jgi:hypothetical protein
MSKLDLEIQFIKLFIPKDKRQRLIDLASNIRHRSKFIAQFNSPAIFNKKQVTEFSGNNRTAKTLAELYKSMGMSGRVYIISENNEWDGKKFQMSYLIGECLGMCIDTIGFCDKSNTAFYEWHHSGTSYFLKNNAIDKNSPV